MFQTLIYKYGMPSKNNHHYENRIELLYSKTCFAAALFCSEADLLRTTRIIELWVNVNPDNLGLNVIHYLLSSPQKVKK